MSKTTAKIALRHYFARRKQSFSASAVPSVRVLMYHDVEDIPSNEYSVSTEAFKMQLSYLREHFPVVSVEDAYECLSGERLLKDNVIVVTIDDGKECLLKNVLLIVKECNIPVTIFLNTFEWSEGSIVNHRYLNPEQVRLMHESGIRFGGHTRSHVNLARLTKSNAFKEIQNNKDDLEAVLKDKVRFFAYPYGLKRHFNNVSVQCVKEAGYFAAFTAINGSNYPGCDLFALKRTKIERADSFGDFKNIVRGALDVWGIFDGY